MTTTDRTWQWQAGVLYRWGPSPWVPDAVGSAFAGLMMLILPGIFFSLGLQSLLESSWDWSAHACYTARGQTRCPRAWVFVAIGSALLVAWSASMVHAVRTTCRGRRIPGVVLHLDAHALHVTIPGVWRRSSPISIRRDDIVAIEPHGRRRRRLCVELRPDAEITPHTGLAPQKPVSPPAHAIAVRCAEPASDAAVLRHFLGTRARTSLVTEGGIQTALRRAGV